MDSSSRASRPRRFDESSDDRGAKGSRKEDGPNEGQGEEHSPTASVMDKQGEEDMWQRHKSEHGAWSEKMPVALERGIKGNAWFSLIDKVSAVRNIELAWKKAQLDMHADAGHPGPASGTQGSPPPPHG